MRIHLSDYFEFYKNERSHETPDCRTPYEVYFGTRAALAPASEAVVGIAIVPRRANGEADFWPCGLKSAFEAQINTLHRIGGKNCRKTGILVDVHQTSTAMAEMIATTLRDPSGLARIWNPGFCLYALPNGINRLPVRHLEKMG